MARKLKTFVTSIGFYDMAIAAPSMKAALEAWSSNRNLFHESLAKETDDAAIVAATMAKPGIILRRPIGSKGAYKEKPDALTDLPANTPRRAEPAKPRTGVKKVAKPKIAMTDKAAILSFEKAKAKRDQAREEREAREAAQREEDEARIAREIAKIDTALERAKIKHEKALEQIEAKREELDRIAAAERMRWEKERRSLEEARGRASK